MNILYLDHYAGSINYGRSFRPYYLGQEWVKKGHKLTVVGGTYSHLRNHQPKAGIEDIDGITYIWLKTPEYQGNGLLRACSMVIFMFQLFIYMRTILKTAKPEVIIGSTVYMLDMFPAWFMKKFSKKAKKLIFELHDLWPLSPMELGGMSKWHPFIIMLKLAELWTYKVADKVVSILPKTYLYVQKFGIKKENFFHIPNGIVVRDWQKKHAIPKEHKTIIDQLKAEKKFLVGYAGAHGISNALTYFIDAAKILQNKDKAVYFILLGEGQEKANLIKYANQQQLRNIIFMERISKKSVPEFLKNMDALYIGLQKQNLFKYGISPNKIFDYMMSSRPIINAINTSNDFIQYANCGITVEAENAAKIAKAIIELKNKAKDKITILGKNGKNYVLKNHDYKILADNFLNCLKDNKQ